jgi:predicted DsbA family dithiol-disulfide isomerase
MKIEVFSDVACPWCYIGKRRLERALHDFEHREEVELTWKSFELAPEMPAVLPLNTEQYLTSVKGIPLARARELIAQCTQIGAAEKLDLNFDKLKLFNTRSAHELLHFAKTVGLQGEFKERLFRASFTEGRQIGDVDILVELAGEVGIDPAAAREALDSGRYVQAVIDDEREAHELGATGVPYFVINGKYGISGAQSRDAFLQALEAVWGADHSLRISEHDDVGVCGPDGCAI